MSGHVIMHALYIDAGTACCCKAQARGYIALKCAMLPMFLPEHSKPTHLRVLHAILLPGSKHPKRLPLHHRSCERQ
jgi:hypothetical protein